MRAWVVERLTEAGEMTLQERSDPVAGAGEYVLRVECAGLNFSDSLILRGLYQRKPSLPFTPGIEAAGTIIAAGPGCDLPVGARICAALSGGGYGEQVVVEAGAARPIPADVPAEAALVLLGINYPTSYHALHGRAAIQPGETVLVHAGAGGVGSAAIQIAVAAGCRVIATAGTEAKLTVCRDLGAGLALDYGDPGWFDRLREAVPGGVDVVYDPVGGEVGTQSLRALAWRGRYLVIGFAAGPLTQLAANRLLLKEASALGVFWGEARKRDPANAERVGQAILDLYRAGQLDPLIGGRFPLEQARVALDLLAARQTVGKILLTPHVSTH